MKKIIGVLVLIIVLLAIGVFFSLTPKQNVTDNSQATAKDIKNTSYSIGGQAIGLVNGISQVQAAPGSASMITTKYFGNEAHGDLNGDGNEDVAFIMTQEGGGSGTFYYVVAALNSGSGFYGTNGILLGDRIAPQTTEIRDGFVIVNYADRGPNDPMTATPSIGLSKYLVIENGALVESPVFVDSPRPGAAISSPLTVTGVAKGPWFFEASFPIVLYDKNGKVLAQSHVKALDDWMTTGYVRFTGTLVFIKPATGEPGTLQLKKDNPSGLPQNDASRLIPVVFN